MVFLLSQENTGGTDRQLELDWKGQEWKDNTVTLSSVSLWSSREGCFHKHKGKASILHVVFQISCLAEGRGFTQLSEKACFVPQVSCSQVKLADAHLVSSEDEADPRDAEFEQVRNH